MINAKNEKKSRKVTRISSSQPWCSHSITIFDVQLQKAMN
jgi:hypothetical protein